MAGPGPGPAVVVVVAARRWRRGVFRFALRTRGGKGLGVVIPEECVDVRCEGSREVFREDSGLEVARSRGSGRAVGLIAAVSGESVGGGEAAEEKPSVSEEVLGGVRRGSAGDEEGVKPVVGVPEYVGKGGVRGGKGEVELGVVDLR